MKKITLILCLLSASVFADQKLENVIETVKIEGEVFGYPAMTKIHIFAELEKQGFKLSNKKLFYLESEHNKLPKIKMPNSGYNYDTKSKSEEVGYIVRNQKNIEFIPSGQRVEKNDWYTLEYNKRLQIYITDDVGLSGQILTLVPQRKAKGSPFEIRTQSTDDLSPSEKSGLMKIVENNTEVKIPVVDKKAGFIDQLKQKIKSSQ